NHPKSYNGFYNKKIIFFPEIVESVSNEKDSSSESEAEGMDLGMPKVKLSEIKECLNCVIDFVEKRVFMTLL
ncbi:hypothetical protein C0J52_17534, partial [Blattella germanica]